MKYKYVYYKLFFMIVLLALNYQLEIPLIKLKDEEGRVFETTNFDDESMKNFNLTLLDKIRPKMPFRIPEVLFKQQSYHLQKDLIISCAQNYSQPQLKGLKDYQLKQLESLYQNDSIIINNYDSKGKFDKGLMKQQDLLMKIYLNSQNETTNSSNQTSSSNKKERRTVNKIVSEYINEHRFMESDSKFDVQTNDISIDQSQMNSAPYFKIQIQSLYSSSVYTQKKPQWHQIWNGNQYVNQMGYIDIMYPASNINNGQGYWLSTGVHKKTDVVSLQIDFDRIYKVQYILIVWAYAPGQFAITTSTDQKTYTMDVEWKEGIRGSDWRVMAQQNQDYKQRYQSYVQHIHFEVPIQANSIRILMKDNFFIYFGIYQLQIYQKTENIMFRGKGQGMHNQCLVIADGGRINGLDYVLMQDCLEAIQMMDARELFIIDVNRQIRGFKNQLCFQVDKGDLRENQIISMGDCNFNSDSRNLWIIDEKQRIKSGMNEEYCLTIQTGIEFSNLMLDPTVTTTATSISEDDNHPVDTIKDGSADTYWKSRLNSGKDTITINLNTNRTAKRITIFWKYSPVEFQVLILHAKGQWESIHTDKDHKDDITKTVIEFSSANIQAIVIRLLKSNSIHNQQSAAVYGINNVVLENDNKAIRIKKCKDFDEIKANQFYQDEWDYQDQVQSNVMLNEKYQLQSESNVLEKYVEKDISIEPLIQKCLSKANELKQRMRLIQSTLDELDIKITNFREKFDLSYDQFILLMGSSKQDREKSTMIGSSSGYPATDCKHVRENYVYKISGFFYVQGECQDNPIRVYCDFSLGKGQFYAFVGPLKDGDNLGVIKKVIDFRISCAKIGLYPVEIINSKQIKVIQQYIQNLEIKLFQSYIITGVDYGCIIDNKCEGKYRSVSSDESKEITLELSEFIDKKNIKNMGFSNKPINAIGFSQDYQLMAYGLIGKDSIKGIICSDNSAFSSGNMQVDLECQTSPKDQAQFQTIINTNTKVHCPKNCIKEPKGQVFGSIMYKSDSSICKAAIHSGAISNNKGGLCYLGMEKGQNEYQGKEANGITSMSYNQFWDQSFVLNKYKKSCPIDQYKTLIKPVSFIQMNDTLQLLQYDEQIKKAILDQEFVELDDSNNNKVQQQQKQQQKIKVKEEKEESMNTQQGIQKVLEMHKQELVSLKRYVKITADANKLTNIINSAQISPLLHSDISVNSLLEQLKGIEMHLQGTLGVEKELSQDVNGRLKETWKQLQLHKVQKIKLTVWKQFIDKYDLEVYMIFDIMDNPKGTGVSKWDYTQSNLKGKQKALCQTSKIEYMNEDQSFGSMVILIYQRFYDQKIIANLMMQGEGIVGVVFRAEDEFNFYVFEMKQNQYKRIRRVDKGESKILEQINDGGYQQDIWYRVIITCIQGIIKVQFGEDTGDYSKDNDMPVIITAEDQLLTQGRAGFMTNNQNAFYVQGFQFIPLDCMKEPSRSNLQYKSPTASRYIENYSGKLKLRWKAYSNPNLIGTPVWIHSQNIRGKDNAISLISKVHSQSIEQPPAMYILSFQKYIKDGIFTASVNPYSDGFVGLVFRFKDKNNYYTFELTGCKAKKQARVRKVQNGKLTVVHQQEDVGYECDKWVKITVQLVNDKFRFLIDEDTPVFNEDVMDDAFKEGEVGILAYMTKADFDHIKLMPFSDLIKKQEEIGAPEEQSFEDVKVQGQTKDREKQVFANDNDKTPKWDTCLVYKTVDTRKLHCNQLYDFDENANNHCVENYCQVCCSKEVDDLHKVRRFQCQNQCEASLISDVQEKPYKICLDSAAPQRSVFSFCRQQFLDDVQLILCQQGFCDLCCVTIQSSHKMNLDDTTVTNCHQDCNDKYEVQTTLRDKDGSVVNKSNIESVIKSIS